MLQASLRRLGVCANRCGMLQMKLVLPKEEEREIRERAGRMRMSVTAYVGAILQASVRGPEEAVSHRLVSSVLLEGVTNESSDA